MGRGQIKTIPCVYVYICLKIVHQLLIITDVKTKKTIKQMVIIQLLFMQFKNSLI